MKTKVELVRLAELVESHDEDLCRNETCEKCEEIQELRSQLFIDGKYFLNDVRNGEIVKFDRRASMANFLGVSEDMINKMLVFGRAAMGYTADYVIKQ